MSEAKRTDEIQGEILHVYDDIEEADNNLPTWWLLRTSLRSDGSRIVEAPFVGPSS